MTAPEPSPAPAEQSPSTNYLDYYGLSKLPFGGSADNAGYILFGSHRRAFELLVGHLVNGSGIVVLLADEGLGKTETLRSAAAVAAESNRKTIIVSRPPNGRVTLHQFISVLQDRPATEPVAIDDAVKIFEQPPRKALVADDVELMSDECVRLLLSLAQANPDDAGNPAIILSSSIDLADHSTRPELAQLLKLARNTIRMPRLGPSEIRQYIERSLWIAGGTTRRLITPDAMKVLIARSGGLPAMVNRLMEAAFTAGFARNDAMITAKTVAAAVGPIAPRPAPHATAQTLGAAARALQIVATGLLVTGASVFLYKALHAPTKHASSTTSRPAAQQMHPAPSANPDQTPAAKTVEPLPPDLVNALMKRGSESLELGDIAAARLLFQRAAAAGNAAAATALGKTYDPNFMAMASTRDPTRAAEWYQKAIALGDPRAPDLLKRLTAR